MKIDFATPFVAAWTLWRRDRALLFPIAGVLLFLPQLALVLLVPPMPRPEGGDTSPAAIEAWSQAFATWAQANGGWYVLAPVATLMATLTIATLYVDRARPTAGQGLARAATLLLRYILATILVTLPMGGLLLAALPAPVLGYVLALPIFYIFARTLLVAPVLVAERPIGAVAAIGRSWRLTAGQGLVLTGIYATVAVAGPIVGSMVLAIGALSPGNPAIGAIAGVGASLATAVAGVTIALIQVVVYGRLASKGM